MLPPAIADALARTLTVENLLKHQLECGLLICVLLYAVASAVGAKANRTLATRVLAAVDGVLGRNFALHGGPRNPDLWWKESASRYKAYASGRRFCGGALLTVDLRARNDLFLSLWYLLSPREDLLEVEVFVNEGAVPQTVLLLGQPRAVRAILRDEPHVGNFAKAVQVAKDRVPGSWPADRLALAAEHPSLLYDLLAAEPALSKALASRWLRSALLTSEPPLGSAPPGPRATFVFALPPEGQEEELCTLLSAAFTIVDLLGGYKASPEMKKKAQDLRQRLQQEEAKKGSQDRLEQLQQKRQERLEAERAKARAAGPAALAKFEEKMQAKLRNREMRKRIKVI